MALLLTRKDSPLLLDAHLHETKLTLQQGSILTLCHCHPEHTPYGIAARAVLQHLDLWNLIQAPLVLGENVAQATQFESSGAAQAEPDILFSGIGS